MKRMSKIMSVILAVVMTVGVFPMAGMEKLGLTASAAPGGEYSGSCGENATWSISGNTLTISGTGIVDSSPWSGYCDGVTTVVINEGITELYDGLNDMELLSVIYFPESLTDIGWIESGPITDIYYAGCSHQWAKSDLKNICIYNTYFSNTILHFNETITEKETVTPTCQQVGYTVYNCSQCGDYYDDCLPCVSHVDNNSDGRCDMCGNNMGSVRSGQCGENAFYNLDGYGNLIIYGEGKITALPWLLKSLEVKKLIIADGITFNEEDVGYAGLYHFVNADEIHFPDGVTPHMHLGANTGFFYDLKTLYIKDDTELPDSWAGLSEAEMESRIKESEAGDLPEFDDSDELKAQAIWSIIIPMRYYAVGPVATEMYVSAEFAGDLQTKKGLLRAFNNDYEVPQKNGMVVYGIPGTLSEYYVALVNTYETCIGGKIEFRDINALPACDHNNTKLFGQIEPKCEKDGYTGDIVCVDCAELLTKGSAIPALGHIDSDNNDHCDRCNDHMSYKVMYDDGAGNTIILSNDGTLTLSGGTYEEYNSTMQGNLLRNCANIKHVVISEGIESIDSLVFGNTGFFIWRNVESISFPSTWKSSTGAINMIKYSDKLKAVYMYSDNGASRFGTNADYSEFLELRNTDPERFVEAVYNSFAYVQEMNISYDDLLELYNNNPGVFLYWFVFGNELSYAQQTHGWQGDEDVMTDIINSTALLLLPSPEVLAAGEEYHQKYDILAWDTNWYWGPEYMHSYEKYEIIAAQERINSYTEQLGKYLQDAFLVPLTDDPYEIIIRDDFTIYGYDEAGVAVDAINESFGSDITFIPLCAHESGITEIRNATEAACTADGYTGDTVCADCGRIILGGEVIPALGHIDEDGDDICDRCGHILDYGDFLGVGPSNDNYWLALSLDEYFDSPEFSYSEKTDCFYMFIDENGAVAPGYDGPACVIDRATLTPSINDENIQAYREFLENEGRDPAEIEEDIASIIDFLEEYADFIRDILPMLINPPFPDQSLQKPVYIGEENCPNKCTDWWFEDTGEDDEIDGAQFRIFEASDGDYLLINFPEYIYAEDENGNYYMTDELSGYSYFGDYLGSARCALLGCEDRIHAPLGHIDENGDGICDRCGEGNAAGCEHENTEERGAVAPTCTEPGYTAGVYCSDCGTYISGHETVPESGHSYGAWTKLNGTQHQRICANDQSHIETEDHIWDDGVVTTVATCCAEGVKTLTCTVCGEIATAPVPADTGNHADYGTHIENAVDATCTEDGYTGDTVCNGCGETLEPGTVEPAKGHDFSGEARKNVDGLTHSFKCARCDAYGVGTAENATEVCSFGNWLPGQSASCYVDGIEYRLCAVCGREETNTIPAHHTLTEIGAISATCEAGGSDACWYCSVCDTYFSDDAATIAIDAPISTPALGHDWGEWADNGDGTHSRVCKRDASHAENEVHDWLLISSTAPDCTTPGDVEYQCSVCGATKTETGTALGHGHTEGFLEDDVPSTCKAIGYYMKVCLDCGEIMPETHDYDPDPDNHVGGTEVKNEKPATCTEGGYTGDVCCKGCGKTLVPGETTEPHGHRFTDYVSDGNATCTEDGTMTAVCGYGCGETDKKTEENSALGHDWGDWADNGDGTHSRACKRNGTHTENNAHDWQLISRTAPDCTTSGSAEYRCSDCGAVKTETDDALGHGHTLGFLEDDVPSTCKAVGYYMKVCLDCGEIMPETHDYDPDPDNHVGGTEVKNEKPATCTEGGYTGDVCCKGCGKTLVPGETTEPHGHRFTDYVSDGNATCTEDGTMTAVCDYGCGETDKKTEENSVLGHDWGEWTETTPATCTEPGEEARSCKRSGCNETETRRTDALGHDYVAVVTEPTCVDGGYTTYTCSRCPASYVADETDALGHDWGEWTETTPATCTEPGEEARSCKRSGCNETETRKTDALGHDYVAVVTEPTCVDGGYTTYTCSRCPASYVADETDALGHDWSEWTIITEATYLHDGERTRSCSRCPETENEPIDKLEPKTVKPDEDTGVDVGFDDDVLPDDTQVMIDREYDGVAFSFLNSVTRKFEMFNITLVCDGQPVQPNGTVRVRIPLPEGYNPNMTRVYYVATDGSGKQLLDSVIEDGYIVFETTHFSDYAIVDESAEEEPESPESNCVCGKYHTGPFAWLIKFMHTITYLFRNLFGKRQT